MPAGPLKPFDPVLADRICESLANSDSSLEEVLDSIGNPISQRTWYRWREVNEEFRQKSARAREVQAEHLVDKALVESRTARMGQVSKVTPKGEEITISDNVERSKLIVQAYFKRAGQLNKALADRQIIAGDPEAPLVLANRIANARKRAK
jgi:hypothetical protein